MDNIKHFANNEKELEKLIQIGGVMVIGVGNGHGDTSSSPERD